MKPIIIFGTGKVAEVVHYYFEHESDFEVAGFTCNREDLKDDTFEGRKVAPFEQISSIFSPNDFSLFVAIGYQGMNDLRASRVAQARELGYELVSFIHKDLGCPKDAQIGQNCFIMNNALVQPKVRLGDNVFVWCPAGSTRNSC